MSVMKSEQAKEAALQKAQAAARDPRLTTAPHFCNASQPNMDKLPHEMRSDRPGADDHAQHKSFGTLC